jgi:hypothetical protein
MLLDSVSFTMKPDDLKKIKFSLIADAIKDAE